MNMIHEITTPTRRQRHRAEKTQSILDMAFALTQKQGLDGLTMPRLAAELDCAVGALYRYYPSKQALIAAMQIQVLGLFGAQLQQTEQHFRDWLATQTLPLKAQALAHLMVRLLTYQDFQTHYPLEFHLLAQTIGTPQPLLTGSDEQAVLQAAIPLLQGTVRIFENLAQTKALKPGVSLERAWILWLSFQGLLQGKKLLRFGLLPVEPHYWAKQLLHPLLQGWGAKEEDLKMANQSVERWQKERQS